MPCNILPLAHNAIVSHDPAIACRHHLLHGDPATQIVQFAEDEGVDLIVMGTHGRTGLKHLLMGSVAEHVLRHARCPVLVVRLRPAQEPRLKEPVVLPPPPPRLM